MENYLAFAVDLAHQAGDIMLKNFKLGMQKEWKADNSPMTVTDHEINSLVLEAVKHTYPEHSILGEEGSFVVEGSTYTWVCDPVDGTIPFSTGVPIFAFSLALVQEGVPMVGVIFDPILNRLYTAQKGGGATLNSEPIHVSKRDSLTQALIHGDSGRLLGTMQPLKDAKAKVARFYCITYPCALIAAGEFDGALWGGPTAWDIAAVKVIVEEAGGKVTDLVGNEQRYDRPLNGAIISNGHLHEKLLTLVKEALQQG